MDMIPERKLWLSVATQAIEEPARYEGAYQDQPDRPVEAAEW